MPPEANKTEVIELRRTVIRKGAGGPAFSLSAMLVDGALTFRLNRHADSGVGSSVVDWTPVDRADAQLLATMGWG